MMNHSSKDAAPMHPCGSSHLTTIESGSTHKLPSVHLAPTTPSCVTSMSAAIEGGNGKSFDGQHVYRFKRRSKRDKVNKHCLVLHYRARFAATP
mmetsp:Transcript_42840/g.84837  ORF Transcript_42840/g.84837 Transcript_42840/m.84837 type:complete len:94 (-) Transcript_42840:951-1232(-)